MLRASSAFQNATFASYVRVPKRQRKMALRCVRAVDLVPADVERGLVEAKVGE